MAISKFQSYYKSISEVLEGIKNENSYQNLSLAFAHWFLKNQYDLSIQEIEESIIDGNADNGIDAIIYNEGEKSIRVFQFKFPQASNINKEISQSDILKTITGFNLLIDPNEEIQYKKGNDAFCNYKDMLKDEEVFKFELNFVSYNSGVIDNKDTVQNFATKFKKESGAEITINYYDKNKISYIFEKMQRKNSINISLPYKQMQQTYSLEEIQSFTGFVNAKDLIDAIGSEIAVIFDENIRLFESDSEVNAGISNTASSDIAPMFYFYNNGVTFICDNADNSVNSSTLRLEGTSIVNGCQTVTSLFQLSEQDNLSDDVSLLVRVIKISDYEERAQITKFLNSQTPIKDSYFISNHPIVRGLQENLKKKDYYLERQINEVKYRERYSNEKIPNSTKIVRLDDVIQYFSGFYFDKYASLAKRQKGGLFANDVIEEILSEITEDRVVKSYETYMEVASVITAYRRYRRNRTKIDFAEIIGITADELAKQEELYFFMNTADILLLNITKHILENEKISTRNAIIKAINILMFELQKRHTSTKINLFVLVLNFLKPFNIKYF